MLFPIYSVDKNVLFLLLNIMIHWQNMQVCPKSSVSSLSLNSCRVYFRSKNNHISRTFIIFLDFRDMNALVTIDGSRVLRYSNIYEIKLTSKKPLLQIQYRTHTNYEAEVDKLMITISWYKSCNFSLAIISTRPNR